MRGKWPVAVACVVVLATAGLALGQRRGKQPPAPEPAPAVQLPDAQVIEGSVTEMLGAWQVGDAALLRQHFADEVTVVSGAWEPPLFGWQAYLQAYQGQRQRMQNVRLERRNTFIQPKGTFAWVAYQWDFSALVDGQQAAARGHTTLVLEKRGGKWLIVHNHTSIVEQAAAAPEPPKPGAQP
jgi:ketosteroid isomerase-like protein